MRNTLLVTICLLLGLTVVRSTASDPPRSRDTAATPLDRRFKETVRPFVDTYCLGCHGKEQPKGDLDLSVYNGADSVARDLGQWEAVVEQLEAGSMPPEKAKKQPTAEVRDEVIAWVRSL